MVKREQTIIAAIVAISIVAVVGVVAIFVRGGEGAATAAGTIFGFVAPTVAALLAAAKINNADQASAERSFALEDRVDAVATDTRERVQSVVTDALADKTVVRHDDLPPSLGGGS